MISIISVYMVGITAILTPLLGVIFLLLWLLKKRKKTVGILTLLSGVCFLLFLVIGAITTPESSVSTVTSSYEVQDSVVTQSPSLAEKLDVQEYTYVVDDSFRYYVMYVTNTGELTVNVEANIVAKDDSGEPVGAGMGNAIAIAPGQTSCIWTTFDEWDVIEQFEYTLSVYEVPVEYSVYEFVEAEYSFTDNKIVASVTNNGNHPAEYVWLDVVFLKDGNMVGFSEMSFMNNDFQLLPGTTLFAEGELYTDTSFDGVVVGLNGRMKVE